MSKQITAMEDYQKENERLRKENARLKNSPTPEELDTASIANEAKNQRIRELEEKLIAIRTAFADYTCSEGCSCCRNIEWHKENTERLAKLLGVPPYSDNSGYNFEPYETKQLLNQKQ